MSESDEIWTEVARRAAVSRFSGVAADDDDVIRGAELLEGALNPNRQGAAGGVGGPGMMPPMMMGGMGGGAGAGGSTGGVAPGAASVGGSAPPPNLPQPSASVGLGVAATAAPVADPAPDDVATPGIPSPAGGGGPSGGGGEGEEPGAVGEPEPPAAPGHGAIPVDGFRADPGVLRSLAARWAEVAQELHGLGGASTEVELGLVLRPERPQRAVQEQISAWTAGAASEFDAIVARLHDVAGQYEAVEDSGVAEIRKETADG